MPDHVIARTLWLVLLAATISLFPFTIYSTFLVPIAESVRAGEAAVGTLRGLGGIAALAVGVGLAPLLARWSRQHTIAIALTLLAAASLTGTLGTLAALIAFCVGTGSATALLTPALLAMATAAFSEPGDAGRAATVVTATQSLAAVLAGPVIGAMGWWNGWRGALWITAGLTTLVAVGFLGPRGRSPRSSASPPGYREVFRRLRSRPDLLALIGIAALRTTSFMGYLSFLAVHYHDRLGMDARAFVLVWTLSGASFFTGNYLAGRWARHSRVVAGRRHRALLTAGLAGGLLAVITVFAAHSLPIALTATSLMGFSHAVVAAQVTTLIAHRGADLTATAYSINAAGMSLGVFGGALLGGIGLGVAGTSGLAACLAFPTIAAFTLVPLSTRTRHRTESRAGSSGPSTDRGPRQSTSMCSAPSVTGRRPTVSGSRSHPGRRRPPRACGSRGGP